MVIYAVDDGEMSVCMDEADIQACSLTQSTSQNKTTKTCTRQAIIITDVRASEKKAQCQWMHHSNQTTSSTLANSNNNNNNGAMQKRHAKWMKDM